MSPKKIWSDPVWSKVIAAGIIALLVAIPIKIWSSAIKDVLTARIEVWHAIVAMTILAGLLGVARILWQVHKKTKYKRSRDFFVTLFKSMTDLLMLEYWDSFIDNAVRGIVFEQFMDNQGQFNKLLLSLIWPNGYGRLKNKLEDMNREYNAYLESFSKHAEPRGDHYKEVKFYKTGGRNPKYREMLDEYREWNYEWYRALHNFVFSLNELIRLANRQIPREDLIKSFHRTYTINDNQGVYNQMRPTIALPLGKIKERSAQKRK